MNLIDNSLFKDAKCITPKHITEILSGETLLLTLEEDETLTQLHALLIPSLAENQAVLSRKVNQYGVPLILFLLSITHMYNTDGSILPLATAVLAGIGLCLINDNTRLALTCEQNISSVETALLKTVKERCTLLANAILAHANDPRVQTSLRTNNLATLQTTLCTKFSQTVLVLDAIHPLQVAIATTLKQNPIPESPLAKLASSPHSPFRRSPSTP